MNSDFYEIPLPALRFEKVEETDTKWTKNTEENDAFQIDHVRSKKRRSIKQTHSQEKRHAKELKTLPEQRQ